MRKKICFILSIGCTSIFADNLPKIESKNNESGAELTQSEIKYLKKVAEEQKLDVYSGVIGTAPKDKTISSTGAALEETPSGPQMFVFWTQTLANGLYYEARLYGKYNMRSQNPAFPDVAPSDEDNPNGYKGVVKVGYNFHVTNIYDITPYLRVEAGNNMSLVYADTLGDYIHSVNYAILPGFKQTFKLTPLLTPYIDIYGGVSEIYLNGQMNDNGVSSSPVSTATVRQLALTTELGAAYKITEHQAIIPYIQFIYNLNQPDATAAASYANGGFNVSQLASSQQVFAVKYSYAW